MLRFSVVFATIVAFAIILALTGATGIAVSPASAYSGEAYNKCMAKCQAQGNRRCTWWCEQKH
jgi:Na+(H+)/acetate symporter ActP